MPRVASRRVNPRTVEVRLRDAGCVFAEDEARILLDVSSDDDDLERRLVRRISGEPLEYVAGRGEFDGLALKLDVGVFIPRQRSEFLVHEAAAQTPPGSVVVDLCCGSGALGLALHERIGRCELHAADNDPAAVACAQRNLARIGGVTYVGDLFDALPGSLKGRVDTLLANVPYVPSSQLDAMPAEARDHEPVRTHDGGADGLDVLRRVLAHAADWLAADGGLYVETSNTQADLAASLMARHVLQPRVAWSDEYRATVVIGVRSTEN